MLLVRKHPKRAMKAVKAPYVGHLAAYANTLTRLIPDLYAGLDVVSRELVGYIPSVSRDSTAERAAVGQAIVWHVMPNQSAFNITPAMATPEPADKTVGNATMTISKARGVEFGWTGEEQRGLNTGAGYLSVQASWFAQAVRTLCNEIEADLGAVAALKASRAYGAVNTIPFATNFAETAQVRKILDDNGAPASERALIIDTTAGANLRTLGNVTKVNEAGSSMGLRDGELLNVHGFSIKESAGVKRHTKGTAASATTDNAGYAVGSTVIALASAGSGTILEGDVITFDGDTNKYVVASGDNQTSNGGSITIAAPGLRVAIPGSATNITVIGTGARMTAFPRSAVKLATRAPALPVEGDSAIDRMMLVDPRSGLAFEVSLYAGYRKIRSEVAIAWGYEVAKSEHVAILLGG